jgi:tetratricopeptide (TPR) repeat protein
MRQTARAACLLLLFPLTAAAQQDALQRALALFAQQDYAAALQAFEEAKRTRAPNAQLENFIGITETRLGQIEAADHSYEAALRLNPKLADAHKNLGYNLIGLKQYDQAEKQLKAALALDATEPFTHYYLVVLYVTTGRDREAAEHIVPAEPALIEDANTSLLAIKAALHAGQPAPALQLIEQMESKSRLTPAQESAVAQLLNDHGMYEPAIVRLKRIVAMEPAAWQNKYNLAVAFARAGKPAEALPLIHAMVKEHPEDAEVLASAASAYEVSGASDEAVRAYQQAIAADPANPDRYLDYTRLLIDLDRLPEAHEVVEQGMSRVPDDYPLIIRSGAIAGMQGNRAQAREAYQKAIAKHPALALGYIALAQSYMKEGNDQEALRILTEARRAVPLDFALEYVYGLISFQLGQQDQALEALRTAERLDPSVAEPHYQLGLLWMKKEQWRDAQEEFAQVLAVDPRNAGAYYQLSRTYQRLGETENAQEASRQASLLAKTQREEAAKAQELRFGVPAKN